MEKNWKTVMNYIDECYIGGHIADEIEYGD